MATAKPVDPEREKILARIERLQNSMGSSEHNKGDIQSRINLANRHLAEYDAKVKSAATPKPAAAAAPAVPTDNSAFNQNWNTPPPAPVLPPRTDVPFASTPDLPPPAPINPAAAQIGSAATVDTVPPPPMLGDAAARVEGTASSALPDAVRAASNAINSAVRKKRRGIASTAITGAGGAETLGGNVLRPQALGA